MLDFIKNILYYIYNLPMKILCVFFSLFCRKRKAIFVYCFAGKRRGDNPEAIVRDILESYPDTKVYWLDSTGMKGNSNIMYIPAKSLKSLYFMSVCKIWISNVRMPYYSFKRKDTIYIQTWHGGIGIKKSEGECTEKLSQRYIMQAKHDSRMIDYIISGCEDCTNHLYADFFWLKKATVLKTGLPRNDIFFRNNNWLIEERKKKFSIEDKKILLYAPTFRNSKNEDLYDLDCRRISQSCHKRFGGDWIVMLRHHSNSMDIMKDRNSEFCIDVSNYPDAQELLVMADVLVTDYSSISMDFILTKRPVFLYAKDIEDYRKERGFHIELSELPFPLSTDNCELNDKILEFNELKYREAVDVFLNQFGCYDDGGASHKITELILKYLIC